MLLSLVTRLTSISCLDERQKGPELKLSSIKDLEAVWTTRLVSQKVGKPYPAKDGVRFAG